jgi:hypothetical protein
MYARMKVPLIVVPYASPLIRMLILDVEMTPCLQDFRRFWLNGQPIVQSLELGLKMSVLDPLPSAPPTPAIQAGLPLTGKQGLELGL